MSTAVLSFTFQLLEQHRHSFYEQMDRLCEAAVQNNNVKTDSKSYDDQKLFEHFFVERFYNDDQRLVHWEMREFDMTGSGYYCKLKNKFNIHRWGFVYFTGMNNSDELDHSHRNQLVVFLVLNRIPQKSGWEMKCGAVADEAEIRELSGVIDQLTRELTYEWTGTGKPDHAFLSDVFSKSVDKQHQSFKDAGFSQGISFAEMIDRCYSDLLSRQGHSGPVEIMKPFSAVLRSACSCKIEPFYVIAGNGDFGHAVHTRHLYINCGQLYDYEFINYLQTLVVYKSIILASLFDFQNRLKQLSIKKLEKGREIQGIKNHFKLFRSNFFVYFKPLFLGRMYTNAWDRLDEHFDLRQVFVSIGEEIDYIDKERRGTEQDLLNRTVVQLTKKTIFVAFITSIFSSFITLIVAINEENFKFLALIFLVMAFLSVAVYLGSKGKIEKNEAELNIRSNVVKVRTMVSRFFGYLGVSILLVCFALVMAYFSKDYLSAFLTEGLSKWNAFIAWIPYDIVYLTIVTFILCMLIMAIGVFYPRWYRIRNDSQK